MFCLLCVHMKPQDIFVVLQFSCVFFKMQSEIEWVVCVNTIDTSQSPIYL
jgi:hypothetical protein